MGSNHPIQPQHCQSLHSERGKFCDVQIHIPSPINTNKIEERVHCNFQIPAIYCSYIEINSKDIYIFMLVAFGTMSL